MSKPKTQDIKSNSTNSEIVSSKPTTQSSTLYNRNVSNSNTIPGLPVPSSSCSALNNSSSSSSFSSARQVFDKHKNGNKETKESIMKQNKQEQQQNNIKSKEKNETQKKELSANDQLTASLLKNLSLKPIQAKKEKWKEEVKKVKQHLKKHQLDGLKWMLQRESQVKRGVRGGILQYKMGLGKTRLALYFDYLRQNENKKSTALLVICPLSVIPSWCEEILKCDDLKKQKVLIWHPDQNRKLYKSLTNTEIAAYDIVLTTYQTIQHNITKLKDIMWRRIYVDESHTIRNPKSKTHKAMLQLQSPNKFCLTGTAFQNYESDIFAQLQFCGYNGCSKASAFSSHVFRDQQLGDLLLYCDYDQANIKMEIKKRKKA